MITPTVGRIVWYHPPASIPTDQPWAAIVAHVWSDVCVNLAVFTPDGVMASDTSVLLLQDGASSPPEGSYCEWMPYQIGQANRYQSVPLPEPTA